MAVTTSIRMPDEVHAQYGMPAQTTGRTRDDLMVEALRRAAEQQLREIALIQEGLSQSQAGLGIPIEDIVARFKAEGMLPPDFVLGTNADQTGVRGLSSCPPRKTICALRTPSMPSPILPRPIG